MRILDALRTASEKLERAGIDDHLADAEILTYHAAGIDRLATFLDNPEINPQTLSKIRRFTKRREKGEPVQYIAGQVTFFGLQIAVGRGVLIPRPETELLVEEAVKTVSSRPAGFLTHILDLCTGSGCIALALAREFPRAIVTGTDLSAKALQYARKNASSNNITNIAFRKGSLFEPIKQGEMFDLITANPPYIISSEIPELQIEVKDWEPAGALDGGEDGLDFYRLILSGAGQCLKPGGALILELGYGQAAAVSNLALTHGFATLRITNDYAGIGRVLIASR